MALLLSYGANPYLSTLMKDSLCYSGAAQRGCYAAIAVAAAHGQRTILHKLLSQPQVRLQSTVGKVKAIVVRVLVHSCSLMLVSVVLLCTDNNATNN